jgi:hypothetical protein
MTGLLLLAAVAAHPAQPTKMIIFSSGSIAVTDYPSRERCEAAKIELAAAVLRLAEERAPKGYHVVAPPPVTAVCIAG